MPWNEFYYPRAMEHLPPLVRSKAIEIANALLEEGYGEGMSIRIAIAKAKSGPSGAVCCDFRDYDACKALSPVFYSADPGFVDRNVYGVGRGSRCAFSHSSQRETA